MVVMSVSVIMVVMAVAMRLGGRVTVTMVVVLIVVMIVIMVVVIVMLAHASFPVEGSAICSSISLSTPVIWASAAE